MCRLVWSVGVQDTETMELHNEYVGTKLFLPHTDRCRNRRNSAYRSLNLVLNNGKKTKSGRFPLPSCCVTAVRAKFPSDSYMGFIPKKSPIIKKKLRKN